MYHAGSTFRPQADADTVFLQVSSGCHHNKCSYCNIYQDLSFSAVEIADIEQQLQQLSKENREATTIFLVDGDTLTISTDGLEEIADLVRHHFPRCQTLSMYSSVHSIASKSDLELEHLHALNFDDFYVGVESGCNAVLKQMNKPVNVEQTRKQLCRLNDAGITHIAHIMFGLAGAGRAQKHGQLTAELVNSTAPAMIWATSFTVPAGTILHTETELGYYNQASGLEILDEEKEFIKNVNLENVPFYATHPTNTIPVSGLITRDCCQMVDTIDSGIAHFGKQLLNSAHHSL